MPVVRFLDEDTQVEVPDGATLFEACIRGKAKVTFMCTIGTCRSCTVRVAEGADHLSAADDDEIKLLDGLKDARLACQATVHGDLALHTRNVIPSAFEELPQRPGTPPRPPSDD